MTDPLPVRPSPAAPVDGRQSAAALEIARGTRRLLAALAISSVPELSLTNGRRADLACLTRPGDIWIVEIKSSIEDFRADQKWPDYRPFCDRLLFAVSPAFPREILPLEAGLIVADRYGAELIREAPEHRLPAARRKMMTLSIARAASYRLQAIDDPSAQIEAALGRE